MKFKSLTDLEMLELLQSAYPDKFPQDDDATCEDAVEFIDSFEGWDDITELLGRVVMLTMPMNGGLTGKAAHCLGKVTITESQVHMVAAVRRDVVQADIG